MNNAISERKSTLEEVNSRKLNGKNEYVNWKTEWWK